MHVLLDIGGGSRSWDPQAAATHVTAAHANRIDTTAMLFMSSYTIPTGSTAQAVM